MERNFREALEHRRSYYAIGNASLISDSELEELVRFAIKHIPSALNSQSTRIVLLIGTHHTQLWQIVQETLRGIVPPEIFQATKVKIETGFASGYGTVLFFEDTIVVQTLQRQYPLYATNFPVWSQQTSAMHQLAIWTLLEDAGFGASLQHYNPLIDADVHRQWDLPESWELIAQMPFGIPTGEPPKKTFLPLEERIKIFK